MVEVPKAIMGSIWDLIPPCLGTWTFWVSHATCRERKHRMCQLAAARRQPAALKLALAPCAADLGAEGFEFER